MNRLRVFTCESCSDAIKRLKYLRYRIDFKLKKKCPNRLSKLLDREIDDAFFDEDLNGANTNLLKFIENIVNK